MNVNGERVLIFGDSLSHHGADDAPEIWDVNTGSNRASSAPGDILASLLLEAGAKAVRIDANVGRSAKNFWTAPNRRQTHTAAELLASDKAFRPTKVIIMLGTNDADAGSMDGPSIARIRDAYQAMGAEVWAVGPPVFASPQLTTNAVLVYGTLAQAFGGRTIDARPMSTTTGRAGDGVHFQPAAARPFATQLAAKLTENIMATTKPAWTNVAVGAGGVLVLGLLGLWIYRRAQRNMLGGERVPAYFVDPNSGDVIEVDQQTAFFRAQRERLPGGKGDGRPDSAFDPKELARGIKVELEHTRDREIAKEIAKDHLTEDGSYYLKLKAIHLDGNGRAYHRQDDDDNDGADDDDDAED